MKDTFDSGTFEEMCAFLSRGRGVDLQTFDARSRKTLRDLYEEVVERDVALAYLTRDMHLLDGRIIPAGTILRVAHSVKVVISYRNLRLCEVRREYPNRPNTKPVVSLKPYGLSETKKRIETPKACVYRGLWEEFDGFVPPEGSLQAPALGSELYGPPDVHDSTVFADIVSHVTLHEYILFLPEQYWKNGHRYLDKDTLIIRKWVNYDAIVLRQARAAFKT